MQIMKLIIIKFFQPLVTSFLLGQSTFIFSKSYFDIQGDQKVSVHPIFFSGVRWKTQVYSNNPHTIYDLKMTITEYILNVDRALLNTGFENTVRRANKYLETRGGHFEHYL
jgi:hypothetical protein